MCPSRSLLKQLSRFSRYTWPISVAFDLWLLFGLCSRLAGTSRKAGTVARSVKEEGAFPAWLEVRVLLMKDLEVRT